jgi:hypothetical protein
MSAAEFLGIAAICDTSQFDEGLRTYIAGLRQMESETDKKTGEVGKKTDEMARKQAAALKEVGLAFSAVGAAGTALLTSMALTASRAEELGVILDVTATNAQRLATQEAAAAREAGDFAAAAAATARASSITGQAVNEQVKAVKELGITTAVANKTVAQLIRYNLDWKQSTDLARLAQDAATFAAQDSSQALDGLIHGITSLNPRVLRTYGILVNLEQEYSKFARANDRTATSLTDLEKQQIAFNAVLRQAPAIAGAYEAAMDTASKQLRSLPRDISEAAEAFGGHLTPMLNSAVGALRDLLHWLADLPQPVQETATQMLAFGTAVTTLAGGAALAVPKIQKLVQAMRDLAIVQQLASAGMLGPAGLVAGLALAAGAVLLYQKNLQDAHQEEAAALAEAAENYTVYTRKLDEAGLSAYGLTEALYKLVKAQEASAQAAYAERLARARDSLEGLVYAATNATERTGEFWEEVEALRGPLSDAELTVLADRDAVLELYSALGLEGERLIENTRLTNAWAISKKTAAQAAQNEAEFEHRRWQELQKIQSGVTRVTAQGTDALRERADWEQIVADREKARFQILVDLAQAEKEYADAVEDATAAAARQMVEAEDQAAAARESAREELTGALTDLEEDHADRVADIYGDIAGVARDLARDIVEAEQKAAREREAIAREMAEAIADAERDLAQDREDAARDLARDLEDIERKAAEDLADLERDLAQDREDAARDLAQEREDLARDLARDLEDIERKHNDKIEDLRLKHLQELEDLQAEHGERLADIEERYAQERADIEQKYSLEPPEPDFDERREDLMEELRRLEELAASGTGIWYGADIDQVKKQLEELKKEELAALEERKKEELEALEAWLAEEQGVREAAYQEALEAEEAAYQEQQDARQRQYEQDLADLALEHQRELEEIQRQHDRELAELALKNERARAERQRAYEQTLQDLAVQHERERAEIARRNAEALADLDAQLAEEKARLEQSAAEQAARLAEQLATEQANYLERRGELAAHYDEQLAEIDAALAEEVEKIQLGLAEELAEIIRSLGEQSRAFRDAYAEQLRDLETYLADRLARERAYQDDLAGMWEAHSPSRWMQRLARDILTGFEEPFQGQPLTSGLGSALEGFQSALGDLGGGAAYRPPAVAPPVVSRSVSTQTSNTINLEAHYARGRSESSLRDDVALLQMTMDSQVPRY